MKQKGGANIRTFQDAIQKLVKPSNGVNLADCEVISIDESKRYCIVDAIDLNVDALPVRLMPDVSDGDFCIPEVGSTIVIAYSDYTDPYMVGYSILSKKKTIVGDQGIEITDGKTTLNDGAFGGLAIVSDPDNSEGGLLKRLNKIEKDINDLKQLLQTALSTPQSEPGNGAPSAFQAFFLGQASTYFGKQLVETSKSDIENPNIIHGKKLKD